MMMKIKKIYINLKKDFKLICLLTIIIIMIVLLLYYYYYSSEYVKDTLNKILPIIGIMIIICTMIEYRYLEKYNLDRNFISFEGKADTLYEVLKDKSIMDDTNIERNKKFKLMLAFLIYIILF
jgi:RsiW-degrading membrane proteinase PrsW (M82 family)